MMLNFVIFLVLIILTTIAYLIIKKIEIKKMNFPDKGIYIKRLRVAFCYLWMGFFVFFIIRCVNILCSKNVVTNNKDIEYLIRVFYCFASTSVGLFLMGFNWRKRSKDEPFIKYSLYYPIILLMFSLLSFSIITLFIDKQITELEKPNVLFYTLAFPVNVFLSFFVDNIVDLVSLLSNGVGRRAEERLK